MNGPVNVLAWLDSLHATTADGAVTNRKWSEAQEARAAVAELIEAAAAVWLDTLGCTTDGKGERLRAALANIGSTK